MLTDARQGYNAKLTTVNFIRILISQTIVFSEFDMSYITDIGNPEKINAARLISG
jgi:hypothetical protein